MWLLQCVPMGRVMLVGDANVCMSEYILMRGGRCIVCYVYWDAGWVMHCVPMVVPCSVAFAM